MNPNAAYSREDLAQEFENLFEWLRGLATLSRARGGMPASKWYVAGGLSLYARYGAALVERTPCTYLCLASIELSEGRRGRGFFTHLARELGDKKGMPTSLGYQALTVESVLEARFAHWLTKHGFKMVEGFEDSHLGTYAQWLSEPVAPQTLGEA